MSTAPRLEKLDWVLLFLKHRPLDRLRLMKALFLLWHRSGRNIPGFFEFVPYLYGPCSFELYSVLRAAQAQHLIARAPHEVPRWAAYHITARGERRVERILREAEPGAFSQVAEIAKEVHRAHFYDLLRQVYEEAPDFARQSLVAAVRSR